MFRATTPSNELFDLWVKDSETYAKYDDATKSMLRRAYAHGWNSAVKSFLPTNSQSDAAFSLGQEINTVLAEFEGEPDRSVAIVGLAFIDDALLMAITSAAVDEENARGIIENRLQNYSTRYQLAYCLGFFRRESVADFESLGWIRNRFAHRRNSRSFGDPGIRERCTNLQTIKAIDGWTETDPRKCFIAAIAVITMALSHRARMEPQRLSWGNLWEGAW